MLERRSQHASSGSSLLGNRPPIEKLKEQAQRLIIDALGLLFPARCAGCQRVDELLCSNCRAAFAALAQPHCLHCGRTIMASRSSVDAGELCAHCQQRQPILAASRSVFRFEGPLRTAIHALKFEQQLEAAHPLVEEMLRVLHRRYPESAAWPIDVVVPVPLHPDREAERGYNQARLLAEPLATAMSLPLADKLLWREHDTRPQVGLDSRQRRENVHEAFRASGSAAGLNILLIDDVRTTGATLEACANKLLQAGVQAVYALTLAQAV